MTRPDATGGQLDPASWTSPVVGVLGGLGPAATAVFLDLLVRATDAGTDQEHLDLLVSQHSSTPDRTARILDPTAADPGPVIARDAVMLERAGARLLVLPCNTAHHFVQGVREATTIDFVSIVEATAEVAARRVAGSGRPVAVFATEGNIRAEVYQHALAEHGAEALVPDRGLQDQINTLIYEQVKANRPVDRDLFERCIRAAGEAGAGTVVLGCTELSVIYDQHGFRGDDRLVDSLTVLAEQTVLAAGKGLAPAFR
ncbi:amino acid racemase [Brachybacterium muris]|uniref:aspartate/glutamate racemase family protein n=1 Tax=Brachybacterium muris TaxID=219301 RepID=UPI00223C0569|nr:amino acid racemase [Brachybacterium muris]